MKTSSIVLAFLMSGIVGLQAQTGNTLTGANQVTVPPPTAYKVVERGANHRMWQRETYEQGPNGEIVTHIHKVQELATGLNRVSGGRFVAASEQIDILPDGSGAATQGQQQVFFPSDIYEGMIRVVTPDGQELLSQPTALAFDDGVNTALIAVLTNSVGEVMGTNQVIYRNAFSGVNADILLTYKLGSFEQDIILRSQIADPQSLNMIPASCRLQVLTEFFNPPTPVQQLSASSDGAESGDTTLRFSSVTFGPGKAFAIGNAGSKNPLKPSAQVPVHKRWLHLQGRTFLIESVPYKRIKSKLQALPLSANNGSSMKFKNYALRDTSGHYPVPAARQARASTKKMQLAQANTGDGTGLVLDYVQISSGASNFTFRADMTYFVSGSYSLKGKTTIEGGSVIKMNGGGLLNFDVNSTINCATGPHRMAVFSSVNDNTVGESFGSGTPTLGDVDIFLNIDATNVMLHDLRFLYCSYAINQNPVPSTLEVWNSQFNNVDVAVYGGNVGLHNVLIARQNNGGPAVAFAGTTMVGENVTANSGYAFVEAVNSGRTVSLTNCLVTGQSLISSYGYSVTLNTNSTVYLPTPSVPVYQTVGSGSYYLTNGSPYRNYGTTNISPALLAGLRQKTTFPPTVFANQTITTNLVLSPLTPRDTNAAVDLGFHYSSLDYVFGGCDLSANLTFTAGTAVGLYEDYGSFWMPIAITLSDGANLTSTGTATQPCWVAHTTTVQEGRNGNWTMNSWMSPIVLNGSGSGGTPQLNGTFTKYSTLVGISANYQDAWAYGVANYTSSEFYGGNIGSYQSHQFFTNCLFYRVCLAIWSQSDAPNLAFLNCTFYNGGMALCRYNGQSASFWNIKNNIFDGTDLIAQDYNKGNTNYMAFDYNAYNTANTNWQTYNFGVGIPDTNKLEVVGAHDVTLTNGYNWQTSWLGNFYLPTNSLIIDKGNTNANLLGFYHFTTQTNQVKEANSLIEIGYHYVATDSSGNPVDTNGDGLPDYLEDANGNGFVDNGELGWNWADPYFHVWILQPRNNASIP